LLTLAVEAAVIGASAAGLFDLAAQGFPGPMHADGGIVGRDSRLAREVADVAIVEIDDLQRLAIFGLEGCEKAGNTLADLLTEEGIGLLNPGGLAAPGLQGALGSGAAAVMVDDGIAEDPIEPGDNLLILDAGTAFDSAHEGGLEDVFGGFAGLDAALEEGEKLAVAAD
jgi:hypothetical protein